MVPLLELMRYDEPIVSSFLVYLPRASRVRPDDCEASHIPQADGRVYDGI